MPGWKAHGVLAFTVNYQGGSPEGCFKGQPRENHPLNPDGSLRPAFMTRMKRILDAADRLGRVPIVGLFCCGQSLHLQTDENVVRATDTPTQWPLAGGWRTLLVEINNESNPSYRPPTLRVDRVHELIARVRATRALDAARTFPVLVNEDNHFDFDAPDGRLAFAVTEHVSWGWFDWRRQGVSFDEGYQSLPVNRGLSSARKRAFHARVAGITGSSPSTR